MIFLRGYLLVVTQHLVIKMEFTVLNSPRGFRSSLGQRPHFLRFLGFNQPLSFLSHLHQPSFESLAMLVYEAQPAILTRSCRSIESERVGGRDRPWGMGWAMVMGEEGCGSGCLRMYRRQEHGTGNCELQIYLSKARELGYYGQILTYLVRAKDPKYLVDQIF